MTRDVLIALIPFNRALNRIVQSDDVDDDELARAIDSASAANLSGSYRLLSVSTGFTALKVARNGTQGWNLGERRGKM
jgi:hypothetical protein